MNTIRAFAVLLVLIAAPLFVSSADDIVFFSENGHYYQVIKLDKAVTNDEAKSLASSKSHNKQTGYIVTIGTLSEQSFLSAYLGQLNVIPVGSSDYPTIWAGGYRSSNSWSWNAAGRISNPFFDVSKLLCSGYCNWNITTASGFPTGQNCMQIYLNNTNGPTPGTWRTATCTTASQALVVEYDASTTCNPGYVYRTSKGWCEDVNECTGNAKICGAGYQCVNTIGSYYCDDINECLNTSICNKGFQCVNGNGSYSCVDVNECNQVPSVCQDGYDCKNLFGSYQCSDINECNLNSSLCRKGYLCKNTPGSYICDDINECDQPVSPCPFGNRCANTIGSYTCDSIYYYIQSDYNPSVVLDFTIVNSIYRVITALKNNNINATNQLWSFTPEGFIVNTANGYVIDAEGGLPYPSVRAILWPRKRIEQASNQLWDYDPTTKYWSIGAGDIVLDIFQAQYNPPAELCLFTAKDPNGPSLNQKWTLIETAFMP